MNTFELYRYNEEIAKWIINGVGDAETIIRKIHDEKPFSTETIQYLLDFIKKEIDKAAEEKTSDQQIERLEKARQYLWSLFVESLISPKRPDVVYKYYCNLFPNMLRIFKGNTEELAIFITFLQKKSASNENKLGNKNLSNKDIAKLISMLVNENIVEFKYYKSIYGISDIHKSLLELTNQNPIFTPKTVKTKINPAKETTPLLTSFLFTLALPFISIYIAIKSLFAKDCEEWKKDYKEWKEKSINERFNTYEEAVDEHEIEIEVDENDGLKRELIRNLIESININTATRSAFSQEFVVDKTKASDKNKKIIEDLKEEYDRHREEISPIFQAL